MDHHFPQRNFTIAQVPIVVQALKKQVIPTIVSIKTLPYHKLFSYGFPMVFLWFSTVFQVFQF